MVQFDNVAGQLVPSGTRTNAPIIALESEANRNVLNNLALINGLTPKLSKVFIHETRIVDNPLDQAFRKSSIPYGVGIEHAQFKEGATNKKTDGTCVPIGNPTMEAQIDLLNFAWSIDISVKDREINKAVMTPEEAGQYIAQKMRTPRKTLASMRYKAMLQLISDVVDGTRSIASHTNSDGTGTAVTYNPSIKGYAGQVKQEDIVLPALVKGSIPAFASAADALQLVKDIENAATEMRDESTFYSKLGISTFTLGKPWLIMESKTLNAIDNAWAMDGTYKGIPTKSGRQFLSTYADIIEIPSAFAALPTATANAKKRLAAVLIDKDSCYEAIQWDDVDGQRCSKERLYGWNYAGESLMGIYRGNPACAFLTKTEA